MAIDLKVGMNSGWGPQGWPDSSPVPLLLEGFPGDKGMQPTFGCRCFPSYVIRTVVLRTRVTILQQGKLSLKGEKLLICGLDELLDPGLSDSTALSPFQISPSWLTFPCEQLPSHYHHLRCNQCHQHQPLSTTPSMAPRSQAAGEQGEVPPIWMTLGIFLSFHGCSRHMCPEQVRGAEISVVSPTPLEMLLSWSSMTSVIVM